MATKKSVTSKVLKNVDKVKAQAVNIHAGVLNTSETLVEESIATGQKWQKLFSKVLQNGTVLFGKQQEYFLSNIETVKDQYVSGSDRLQKLLGIEDTIDFTVKKAKATVKAAVAEVEKLKSGVLEVKVKKSPVAKIAKTETTKVKNKIAKVAKAKTTKVKKSVAKASPKKVVVAKKTTVIKKDNLTVINGIGPKLATILNQAGVTSFKLLAATDINTIKSILEAAGPRYSKFDPKTWKKQAKLAAAGKLK